MSKWHKGPPPSVGWWPASSSRQPGVLRWWDGKRWSFPALTSEQAHDAAVSASIGSGFSCWEIEWTDRPANWPERSKT